MEIWWYGLGKLRNRWQEYCYLPGEN